MFFDNPVTAFTHLRAHTASHARLLFSCFRDRAENDWANLLGSAPPAVCKALGLPDDDEGAAAIDPKAPGPFAFANPEYVRGILGAAGWANVAVEAHDVDFVVGAGADPVADALEYFRHIGAIAAIWRDADAAGAAMIADYLSGQCRARLSDGRVVFRAAIWLWTAQSSRDSA